MSHPRPAPLLFEPLLMSKVWGGDRLARFGKPVPAGSTIGESWELADMGSTSASGAGGAAARSIVRDGPMRGRSLQDCLRAWGSALLGDVASSPDGGFPLLIKYLDARENLSVQVHPSPAYARTHAGAHLKTECWYILDAEPGSVIYKGVRAGVTREAFERELRTGDGKGVVALMGAFPARRGDMHNLPSGTVHALGAGVLVAEVQTPSDTTFRVYDWGRSGRELHIDQSLACIQWEQARDATSFESPISRDGPWARLVTTGYFDVDESRPAPGAPTPIGTPLATPAARPAVLMVLEGDGLLAGPGFDAVSVHKGDIILVPAVLAKDATLAMKSGAQSRAESGGKSEGIVLRAMPR
jgi:mannose-6-phosphate isomerase